MSPLNRPAVLLLAALAPLATAVAAKDGFTDQFPIAACDFRPFGGNSFIRLSPGRQLYLNNQRCVNDGGCDEFVELWITMLDDTRVIQFTDRGTARSARTRVMQEYETVDGELDEVSRNYVANCAPMNDVYYFGEDVEDGDGNPLPDAWLAGRNGARPGILLPDRAFLLGSRYYQEIAENARDRSEHTSMGFTVDLPAGRFRDCVDITETTPLEPGKSSLKTYCPNVGIVRDGELELVRILTNAQPPGGD